MFLGEFTSCLCLGVGQLSSVLVRGAFGLVVGICDVLAACMCCWQVPFSDRPDRDGYTYATLNADISKAQLFQTSLSILPEETPKSSRDLTNEKIGGDDAGHLTLTLAEMKEGRISPRHEKQAKAAIKAALAQEKRAKKSAAREEKKQRKSQEVSIHRVPCRHPPDRIS